LAPKVGQKGGGGKILEKSQSTERQLSNGILLASWRYVGGDFQLLVGSGA